MTNNETNNVRYFDTIKGVAWLQPSPWQQSVRACPIVEKLQKI